MCLKRIPQAKAEFVGIGCHAKLLLFAQNGLFGFRVAKAHKAIGKISGNIVGKSVGNASASIPGKNRVQIGGAFASRAGDFNFVLALEKAHAKARANIGREGRAVVKIPIRVEEQGLKAPGAFELSSFATILSSQLVVELVRMSYSISARKGTWFRE